MIEPAVVADGLTVWRGSNEVLAASDFTVEAGSVTTLIGANGSGKTTLLQVIAGLLAPSAGSLRVTPGQVALVAQHAARDRWMPLCTGEVVRMGRYARSGLLRRLSGADRAAIADAARRCGVGDLLGRQYGELSDGQRQRARIAQALAAEPSVLLLDEPYNGLDVPSRAAVAGVITAEASAGRTVLFSTHHLDDAHTADQVLVLAGGVIASGTPDEVLISDVLSVAFSGHLLVTGDLVVLDDHGHDGEPCHDEHAHAGHDHVAQRR